MYKTETTEGNFKARVAGVVRAGKSIRENVKVLMQFAIVVYLKTGNTECSRHLLQEVKGLRSMSDSRLGQWTEFTVNVRVGKNSDGDIVVRKAVKGEEPALTEHGDIDSAWWEFAKAPANNAVDMIKDLESLIKKIESTQGDEPKKSMLEAQRPFADGVATRLLGAKAFLEAELRRAELEAHADVEDISAAA